MKRIQLFFFLVLAMGACQTNRTTENQALSITLQGEMLFSGANTLQSGGADFSQALAEASGIPPNQWKEVRLEAIELSFPSKEALGVESLLFQVVSNEQELVSLGTLNPVPQNQSTLSLPVAAEAPDLLPYFQDQGLTWVLDLNLPDDHMDLLEVTGNLIFSLEYQER